jgi:hypothetical protein
MKTIIIGTIISAIAFTACNSGNNKIAEGKNSGADTTMVKPQTDNVTVTTPVVADTKATVSIKEILAPYLQMKNAFTKDNANDAAAAGTALETAFENFDTTVLTDSQKKLFDDIADDAKEHGEHIGKNGGNIKHQREHFEMLTDDIYDLVKSFGAGQILYKDFCPMYNDGKGAFWISETKEIKNPYFGKAMSTCGTIKEEMK